MLNYISLRGKKMNDNKNEMKIKIKEIYLLKYKTNQSDDIKYKAF
ncbi:hypothetical protein SAP269_05120 [Spiroplasma ixodetis]|uniref:Uncharacterized protein n=1 Tax=Spiroplasma ixodetis TaxID=2141 RepID=A0ABM8JL92_9MOLU